MANSTSRFPVAPVVLVAGLASVLSLLAFVLFGGEEESPVRAVADVVDDVGNRAPQVRWPAGERQTYRVSYQNDDMLRPIVDDGVEKMASDPVRSSLKGEFEVVLTGMGPGEGETDLVAIEVVRCVSASFTALQQPIWESEQACDAALKGHVVYAEVERSGMIPTVFDSPATEASTRLFLQTLLMRLQTNLSPPKAGAPVPDSWFASEPGIAGVASQVYDVRRRGERDSTWIFGRRTTALHNLRAAQGMAMLPTVDTSGATEIALTPEGVLERVEGREQFSATTKSGVHFWSSQTTYAFTRIDVTTGSVPPKVAGMLRRRSNNIPESSDTARTLLENQADGLTLAALTQSLKTYGNGGRFPDHERFLWRSVGLLKLHPEYATALLPIYRNPNASNTMRALVLDILASTGGPEAQAVMREVLVDVDALTVATPEYRQLYQRLGFLQSPTTETVSMVVDHYEELRATDTLPENSGPRLTTAYSLGALAGKLSEGDEAGRERAAELHAMLVEDIEATSEPSVLHHLVTAPGNTKDADSVDVLEGLSSHDSSKVRISVARAFGKTPTDVPNGALLDLVGDPDVIVQRTAIRSLSPHDSVFATLLSLVEQERIARTNIRAVLSLVQKGRSEFRGPTTRLLEAMVRAGIENGADREAAYRLLAM